MLKRWILAGASGFLFSLLTVGLVHGGEAEFFNDPILAIEQDFQDGKLTLDEKVMFQIKAIKRPFELPQKYQLFDLSTGITASRSATMALKEIVVQWDYLSNETQQAFREAFSRWPTTFTYDSPSGFFKLHYDTSGTNQVPSADDDFSGVPDFVEKCAAYCDTTLDTHLLLGFIPPPSDGGLGGDERYDIYFENMGYYGYTVPEGPGPEPWNDYYSYLVLHHNFLGFPPNNDPEGDQYGAAKVTAAHEFHHAVQFAYDLNEGLWFMELDAVCMEDIVFDRSDDNYNYLNSFFNSPQKSLMENSSHMYSCFIWGLYLAQKFDTSLLVAIWEGARYDNVFDVLSDTLQGRYGWTQDSAFADFSTWNFCTGIRDDGQHHEEASYYPLASVGRTHSSYPVTLQTSPCNPAGYGSCYVQFFPSSAEGRLRITFNGDDTRQWAAYLIKSMANNVHEFEKLTLDPLTYYGVGEVEDFKSYYRVVLVGANVSESSGGAFFSYSAEIIPPYSVSSAVLTVDSAVYSGGTRAFEYQVINTSPLSDVFDITAWDDFGWITPDTINKALGGGRDTVFTIPVHPPQGTPLETESNLYFKVRSRSDTTVADSQSVVAKVMLQRGDANFSGQINVTDVTYLVNYLFRSGPSPIPVSEAGDANCDTKVNVTDLTALVAYLFRGGSPPPCNPY
jgi:hypothetical protein